MRFGSRETLVSSVPTLHQRPYRKFPGRKLESTSHIDHRRHPHGRGTASMSTLTPLRNVLPPVCFD